MTQTDTNGRNRAKVETPEHWGISIAQFQSTVFPKIEGCSSSNLSTKHQALIGSPRLFGLEAIQAGSQDMCLRLHEAVGKWAYAPLCMFETSKWPYCFRSYSLFTSFKINQSFNEIPFPSIQFILTAYTKLPGSEGLDLIHLPQSTQFLKNKHNLMTWKPPTQGIQWESNAMTLESVVILRAWPVRHTFDCQRSLSGLCFTDSTHARDWFASWKLERFPAKKVSFRDVNFQGQRAPEANITVVHLSSAYVRETGKLERTSKYPG